MANVVKRVQQCCAVGCLYYCRLATGPYCWMSCWKLQV